MIPKIIHYCWLSGDPYPENVNRCITSWREKLPDYEFWLWDIFRIIAAFEGYDVSTSNYTSSSDGMPVWIRQAIERKKYAFAADYVRAFALYKYGGIYLDTDVEVIGSFEQFLSHRLFIGFDYVNDFEAAVVGTVPGHPWIKKLIDYYEDRSFVRGNGGLDTDPLPTIFEKTARELFSYQRNGELQQIIESGITIYPYDFFSPKDIYFDKINITGNTITIHHFDGSWVKKDMKYSLKRKFHQVLYKIGSKVFHDRVVEMVRRVSSKR